LSNKFAKKLSEISFRSADPQRQLSELERQNSYAQSVKQLPAVSPTAREDSQRILNVQMEPMVRPKRTDDTQPAKNLEVVTAPDALVTQPPAFGTLPPMVDRTYSENRFDHEKKNREEDTDRHSLGRADLFRLLNAQAKFNEGFIRSF
jgi:hypothetical protein